MKLRTMLVGLLLAVVLVQPSKAMTRIDDDMGGSLGQYLLKFAAIRDLGERVMIDGSCFSACTLVTALIPKQRVCVTERAKLGFHAGWIDDQNGQRAVSVEGTSLLYQMYPRENSALDQPSRRSWDTNSHFERTRTDGGLSDLQIDNKRIACWRALCGSDFQLL